MRKPVTAVLIGLIGVFISAGGAECLMLDDIIDQVQVARLRGFSSSMELRSYLASQARLRNQYGYGYRGGWDFVGDIGLLDFAPVPAIGAPESDASADGDTGQAGGDPYSTTNIQEAGVDESDIVKNDGDTIYVLDGSTIHIVEAVPGEDIAEAATIDIEGYGDSLYLRGDTLVALSSEYTYVYDYPILGAIEPDLVEDEGSSEADDVVGGMWNDGGEVIVTVIDVSEPREPRIEATVTFEGNLSTSRLIGSRLHLVLTSTPRLPQVILPIMLDLMTVDQWLPDYELEGADGTVRSGDIVDWQDCYHPEDPDGYGITTIVTMDIENPTAEFESSAITADAGVVYASTEALYVTDTDYNWTLTSSREQTDVHKLAFTDSGTRYVASGTIPGRPLNQYSLGEYQDYLRIATTVNDFGMGGQSVNNVYVLGEGSNAELEIVGEVTGLAPGETIYAARFLGDRGFLVTFVRVDPLFTMDLSDPTNPRVVGELKVPGYSDHIQLMDSDHLLTIGKDAADAGDWGAWIQGLQLSIFDVSDMENPRQIWKETIGVRGTHSEANTNPKAFNYFPAKDVLAFPIDLYVGYTDSPWSYGQHVFTGLYVYRVTVDEGFKFLGGIPSRDDDEYGWCYWSWYGFTRGVFIGDTVYSATQNGVKAAMLDDVERVIGVADFTDGEFPPDCWYYEIDDMPMPGGGGLR